MFPCFYDFPRISPYGHGSKPMVPYLDGYFTSINPSYFDVNKRGTGFWPITIYSHMFPLLFKGFPLPSLAQAANLLLQSAENGDLRKVLPGARFKIKRNRFLVFEQDQKSYIYIHIFEYIYIYHKCVLLYMYYIYIYLYTQTYLYIYIYIDRSYCLYTCRYIMMYLSWNNVNVV